MNIDPGHLSHRQAGLSARLGQGFKFPRLPGDLFKACGRLGSRSSRGTELVTRMVLVTDGLMHPFTRPFENFHINFPHACRGVAP